MSKRWPSGKATIWIIWLSRITEISNEECELCWDSNHFDEHRRSWRASNWYIWYARTICASAKSRFITRRHISSVDCLKYRQPSVRKLVVFNVIELPDCMENGSTRSRLSIPRQLPAIFLGSLPHWPSLIVNWLPSERLQALPQEEPAGGTARGLTKWHQ